jgi:hypothetical protein
MIAILILSIVTFTTAGAQQQQEAPDSEVLQPKNGTTTFVDDSGLVISLPSGWSVADRYNNTGLDRNGFSEDYDVKSLFLQLCPPGQSVIIELVEVIPPLSEGESPLGQNVEPALNEPSCSGKSGFVSITEYSNMDRNPDFAAGVTSRDPETGLLVLNLTAQDIIDYNARYYPYNPVVQSKDVPVTITNASDGTS